VGRLSAVKELTITLIKAGMDPVEATILIARAGVEMAPPVDARKPGARRQAAYRERHKASPNVTEVTLEKVTESVTNRNETSLSDSASLSKEEKKETNTKKRERANASQLPSEWRPSSESWTEALTLLGGEERTELELKKFRNHASEKGRIAKNWNSAWANWAIKAVEYGAQNGHRTSGNRTSQATGPAQTGADSILAGMGRLAARVAERQLAERQHGLDLANGDGADGRPAVNGRTAHHRPG
jgi:hypothetical protein